MMDRGGCRARGRQIEAPLSDLKSCSAFGDTPEETLREVLIAKEPGLAAAKKRRKPISSPRYRPAIYAVAV